MFSTSTRPASFLVVAACLLALLLPACMSSEAASIGIPVVGEREYPQSVCCAASTSVDDAEYLYTMTIGGADQPAELHVLTVNDEGYPDEEAVLDAPVDAIPPDVEWWKVSSAVANDRLYIPIPIDNAGGIWVLDISDPRAPVEVTFVETDFIPTSMSISGSTAAVATQSFGTVALFDLSNPDQPQFVTNVQQLGRSMPEVGLVEDTLYVYSISGVGIFDVSDIKASQQIGSVDLPTLGTDEPEPASGGITPIDELATDEVSDVAIADNEYLFGVAGSAGLSVVDITDPIGPEQVASMDFDLPAREVAIDDDRLNVLTVGPPVVGESISDIPWALHVIDVSEPSEPKTIDTIDGLTGGLWPWQSIVLGDESVFILNNRSVVTVVNLE